MATIISLFLSHYIYVYSLADAIYKPHVNQTCNSLKMARYMPETRVGAFFNKYKNILQLVRAEICVQSVWYYTTLIQRQRKRSTPLTTRSWIRVPHGLVKL